MMARIIFLMGMVLVGTWSAQVEAQEFDQKVAVKCHFSSTFGDEWFLRMVFLEKSVVEGPSDPTSRPDRYRTFRGRAEFYTYRSTDAVWAQKENWSDYVSTEQGTWMYQENDWFRNSFNAAIRETAPGGSGVGEYITNVGIPIGTYEGDATERENGGFEHFFMDDIGVLTERTVNWQGNCEKISGVWGNP